MAHQHRFLKHRMIERDTEREPQIVETGMGFFCRNHMHAAQREAAYPLPYNRTERIFCIICVYRRVIVITVAVSVFYVHGLYLFCCGFCFLQNSGYSLLRDPQYKKGLTNALSAKKEKALSLFEMKQQLARSD
nr:hypothetical protein CFP56_33221 [Quercus suber]